MTLLYILIAIVLILIGVQINEYHYLVKRYKVGVKIKRKTIYQTVGIRTITHALDEQEEMKKLYPNANIIIKEYKL